MPRLRHFASFALLVWPACGGMSNTVPAPTSTDGTGSADGSSSGGGGSSSVADETGTSTGGGPACGSDSPEALARCVDPAVLLDDVSFVADLRTPDTAHWQAVQDMCADRMEMLGMEVELHEYATGVNVVGRRRGTTRPDELVLIGAHYDHIPGCLGADDNATGVAGALEAARILAPTQTERTLAVACWDEEELGLLGSSAWVALGLGDQESVSVYFNYDMIGYATDEPDTQGIPLGFDAVFPEQFAEVEANDFRGDFILMAADELAAESAIAFENHAQLLGLPTVTAVLDAASKNSELFSDLRRSDHAPFWAADIPAMFFTDSANFRNEAYHCAMGEDSVDRLDFEFAGGVVGATVGAVAEALVLQ